MMRTGLWLFGTLISSFTVEAQQPAGGMGYIQQVIDAYPLLNCSVTGATRQPAALAYFDRYGVIFRCQKPAFKESPPEFLVSFALPASTGSFIAALDHFRLGSFRQTQMGIGYGLRLASGVALGLKLNYYQAAAVNYPAKPAFPVELGACYTINSVFTTGLSFYNIIPLPANNQRQNLPAIVTATWSYAFSEYLSSVFQITWMDKSGLVISAGLRLNFKEKMRFNFGYSSQLQSFSGSAGYTLKGIILNLSLQWHPSLGMLNAVELGWSGKQVDRK